MRKANKIFALSVSAMLSAVSCINTDKTLGVDFVPTNQDISIRTAEFDLPVGQRLSDSLQATLAQTIVVGSLNAGESGIVQVG